MKPHPVPAPKRKSSKTGSSWGFSDLDDGKTTLLCRLIVRSLKLAWPGRCKEFGVLKGLHFFKMSQDEDPSNFKWLDTTAIPGF